MPTEIVVLKDDSSGSEARILSSFGMNCYRFRPVLDGQPVDVLWSEPGFDRGDRRASGSGIPLLFPYPGRLRGKTFRWNGKEYPAEGDDGRGNAIHGYVLTRPWRVMEQTEDEVTAVFRASIDAPELVDAWPADFQITARYAVKGTRLDSELVVENPDSHPLPFGLGTHPYFRLPLGDGDAGACRMELTATERWELVDMLPTGQRLAVPDANAYKAGVPFAELQLDEVFTGLRGRGKQYLSRIVDPNSDRVLSIRFDRTFTECVVYTPPHREAICIEPYTCVPNTTELHEQGNADPLQILEPGQSFRARVSIELK